MQAAMKMERAWMRCHTLLFGAIVWLAAAAPAGAFIAYVSNEKSNTLSVIDTDKWAVIKTIKVGERRAASSHQDGKLVLVAVGDDETIEVIDTATKQVVDGLPSALIPSCSFRMRPAEYLYVANENDNTVTIIDIERRARVGDVQVGVEPKAWRSAGWKDSHQYIRDSTNMAHSIDTATRQIVATCWSMRAALRRVQARRLRTIGSSEIRRHGFDDRSRKAHGHDQNRIAIEACARKHSSRSASA